MRLNDSILISCRIDILDTAESPFPLTLIHIIMLHLVPGQTMYNGRSMLLYVVFCPDTFRELCEPETRLVLCYYYNEVTALTRMSFAESAVSVGVSWTRYDLLKLLLSSVPVC